MTPLPIGERNIIEVENGKLFANCRLFDDISGKEISNKFRKFETLVGDMLTGTNLNPKELIRRIAVKGQKHPPCICSSKIGKTTCTAWI